MHDIITNLTSSIASWIFSFSLAAVCELFFAFNSAFLHSASVFADLSTLFSIYIKKGANKTYGSCNEKICVIILTAFRDLCWLSKKFFNGFTTSSASAFENCLWISHRLSISVETLLQESAIVPGRSRHALFNFNAIFDSDFA